MGYLTLYKNKESARTQENWLVGGHDKKSAYECIKCSKCEEVCSQHISIRGELVKVNSALTKN